MIASAATLGPPPGVQTFYTLGAAALVAVVACLSRTIQQNKGVVPAPGVLLSELGMGLVAGVMLPLWIGDISPIGFGTAVVLGGIGGAFGFTVIKGIANVLGGKWGVKIEETPAATGEGKTKGDDSKDEQQQPDSAPVQAER